MNDGRGHVAVYERLFEEYGDLKWWPAEGPDEIVIGAILTQNTSWRNVEKSLKTLRENDLVEIRKLASAPLGLIVNCVRSSGFYNQKASSLRELSIAIIEEYGSLSGLSERGKEEATSFLMKQKGIGPETMESIMLYALGIPVPVIDAYTTRILGRVGGAFGESRAGMSVSIENALGRDIFMLKNYHAMLVELGKDFCRKKPSCAGCPLNGMCDYCMSLSSP